MVVLECEAFDIVFDGAGDVVLYTPGDWVVGHVRLVITEPLEDVSGIKIKFKGEAKNKWIQEVEDSGHRSNVLYTLTEKYFEEKINIKDNEDGGNSENIKLDGGEHKFPFKFQIPSTPLPYAFEGESGYVRYKVSAKIEKPGLILNTTTRRLFYVTGTGIDLNTKPDISKPSKAEEQEEKTTGILCCATYGSIMLTAETDKSGYVPGETIWVLGSVNNNSNHHIGNLTAKLIEEVAYKGKRFSKSGDLIDVNTHTERITLAVQTTGGCGEYDTASLDRKPLHVPSCPPSELEGCGIIDISYFVEFKADDTSETPFTLELLLPITIGTVPLNNFYSAAFPPVDVPGDDSIQLEPTGMSAPVTVHPPVTHKEVAGNPKPVVNKFGGQYTYGQLTSTPVYPYYNFPSPVTVTFPPGDLAYPPPIDGMYPSPADGVYHPPPPDQGIYPPPAEGTYTSYPVGAVYPPPAEGLYPPPTPSTEETGPPCQEDPAYPPPVERD